MEVFLKFSERMLNGMNLSLKLDIFELLIRYNFVVAATEFACKLFQSLDKDLLSGIYSILGRCALVSAKAVAAVYKALGIDNYARALIIESLPPFEGVVSNEFGAFIKLVLSELPTFGLFNHKKPMRKEIVTSNWMKMENLLQRGQSQSGSIRATKTSFRTQCTFREFQAKLRPVPLQLRR